MYFIGAPGRIGRSLTRCQKHAHYRYPKEQNINELHHISYSDLFNNNFITH